MLKTDVKRNGSFVQAFDFWVNSKIKGKSNTGFQGNIMSSFIRMKKITFTRLFISQRAQTSYLENTTLSSKNDK